MYKNKEEELVLALLSELYSRLDTILVNTNLYSFCPILHCILTTQPINYCLNEIVNKQEEISTLDSV